jgi:CheY-like chemotaxis protein
MASRPPRTVLVVEHEPQVLRVLREILRRAGFTVLPARSGAGALRLFQEHGAAIDLLLIDCLPPEIEQLARRHPELKLLGLFGYAGAEFAGNVPVLKKPFTPAALVGAVHSVLEGEPKTP